VNTISTAKLDGDFFAAFERSAWRLELLPEYDDEETRERVAQFLAGRVPLQKEFWTSGLRTARAQGKTIGRVHVIGELTDYLRYELAMYQYNVQAGEDIRILPAELAAGLDLPDYDYWLLDRTTVIRMNYGDRGAFVSREIITDPGAVARCARASDAAMSAAVPLREYLARRAA
jgi:hypothetical protein